jgi:hypothetical protein
MFKILYLCSRYTTESKLDPGRYLQARAVEQQSDVLLRFWGDGWPGWNRSASVMENMRLGGYEPDVIWVYKPGEHPTVTQCPQKLISVYQDFYPKEEHRAEVEKYGINLIVHLHQDDLTRWPDLKARRFFTPQVADPAYFSPPTAKEVERDIPCLLTGVRDQELYPLRERFHRLILSGKIPGEVREHPPYRLRDWAQTERQYQEYAAQLRRTKIALCCSSKFRYPLQKFTEAMAAGCVVVGDMPNDEHFHDTMGRHLVAVDMEMTDEQIAYTIEGLLEAPYPLKHISKAGKDEWLSGFTPGHFAGAFVREARRLVGS